MAKSKKQGGGRGGGREVATAYKLLVVQERMKGTPQEDVAAAFGVSVAAVQKWTTAFRKHGPSALESKRGRAGRPGLRQLRTPPEVREQVEELKRTHEDWGTRRIRDVLARFSALGVSEQAVRAILHEAGLIETPAPRREREHQPRRFERATPNQLWQSDIFTFRLRRAERLYVCVFMDDHSRFVVGHSMAHHQRSALVMEAFERGVAAYGNPAEVLTDNGRQYTVWRGRTEFEETLTRMGIQHIRSRPQHPQTLGKVERFWKTLWDEFLGRTVFAHVVDAQHRLEHFISHYNFQRPHQALDGLVPADRFFRAAAHVRAEIERAVAANELRLALEQPPRKPFYVVGQLGDQRLSIAAGASGLEVLVGDKTETIPLQEDHDGTSTVRRFVETQEPADAAMAGAQDGPGRGGAQSRAARAGGVVGREAGDDGDRGGRDLARVLLPARDQGAQRDAVGARARGGQRRESGRDGTASAHQAARGEAGASGIIAATSGAPVVGATEADELWSGEDTAWETTEGNALDASWAEKLAFLDDEEDDAYTASDANPDEPDAGESTWDPNAGWRDRGPLRWERKLAGADAASDNIDNAQEPTAFVHAGASTPIGSGRATTIRGDRGGPRADADGRGSSAHPGAVAQSLPDDPPSCDGGDDRGDHAEARRPSSEAGAGSATRSGEHTTSRGERSAPGASGDRESDDECGGGDRVWSYVTSEAEEQEDEERGGPGTGELGSTDESEPDGFCFPLAEDDHHRVGFWLDVYAAIERGIENGDIERREPIEPDAGLSVEKADERDRANGGDDDA